MLSSLNFRPFVQAAALQRRFLNAAFLQDWRQAPRQAARLLAPSAISTARTREPCADQLTEWMRQALMAFYCGRQEQQSMAFELIVCNVDL
ncbi:hypothetical protein P368_11605 [Comamonas thiooxydans]|nr:hypothetical protein P369_10340 [Comamonas thiooxydans]KGG98379.1 hypothetical protein P367_12605 [Comamonas thiooxydans]KGH04157.1 hypothetical protein P365_13785 [Comamonas thiooxydans]KGH12460.1 hypothetical protein P368_11605 [Comamonas thiooxydans]KGH20222.1 hypothetical protein P606_21340 [Comamonas thiooxydans]